MLPPPSKSVAVLVSVALVLAGVAVVGTAPGDAGNADQSVEVDADLSDAVDADGASAGSIRANAASSRSPTERVAQDSTCAAAPTAGLADPPSDVVGWENGAWYNESIAVDQSDGLNRSEQDLLVARTTARVESLRCVEFDRTVPVSVIDRASYRERAGGRNYSPAFRTFDNVKFESLFLIGESNDSLAVQRSNRGASVLGFYSPTRDEIVVIAESRDALRINEFTLAHELMHAWQDERFNLSSSTLTPGVRDEANALDGLVEGSASHVQDLYERRCREGAWNGTCRVPSGGQGGGQLANVGVYLLKFQPYSDGPVFVRTVKTMGGWDAVDALYDQPPASTEQVIHVERYGVDEPEHPTIEDRTTENWTRVRPPGRPNYGSVGEAAVMSMFVYPYYDSQGKSGILPPSDWLNYDERGEIQSVDPIDYESNYSEGWDGDRLHVYRNAANETAYVWRLEWDSPQDAREFVRGYRRVLDYWGGEEVDNGTFRIDEGRFADAFHVGVDGTTVTIVNAPTVDQLDEVRTDLANGSAPSDRRPP